MLRSLARLQGVSLEGTDGDVGTIARFLVDRDQWVVRYIVVKPGNWFSENEVLISPWSILEGTNLSDDIVVSVTRDRVRNAPTYDSVLFTREHEHALVDYYGHPAYWNGPMLWGTVPAVTAGAMPDFSNLSMDVVEQPPATQAALAFEDSHLADSRTLLGTHLQASDGAIGHVDDCLVEPDTWRVRYLVIDTNNWWLGKHVLIAPNWIAGFDWPDRKLHVTVDRAAIKNAPEYDAGDELTREDEVALYRHYGRDAYWSDSR